MEGSCRKHFPFWRVPNKAALKTTSCILALCELGGGRMLAGSERAVPSCLTGQGLDTHPEIGVFGQWVIRPHLAVVHRGQQCRQNPTGVHSVIGVASCGRRYLRFDVETLASRLGLPVDDLMRANKQHALEASIQSVTDGTVTNALKVVFVLRDKSHEVLVPLREGRAAIVPPAPAVHVVKSETTDLTARLDPSVEVD